MKKMLVLTMVISLVAVASVVMAHDEGMGRLGQLSLYQKCDDSLIGQTGHDAFGCPLSENGPWPILFGNYRWGRLSYTLWGDDFAFTFQGRRLLPQESYTLIYYPDPWPGDGLICLGNGRTNRAGNMQIHGKKDLGINLPAAYDKNFTPISPSGAVGAKIWLVLSEDVRCPSDTDQGAMIAWNPTAYLFEGNLIAYQYLAPPPKKAKNH